MLWGSIAGWDDESPAAPPKDELLLVVTETFERNPLACLLAAAVFLLLAAAIPLGTRRRRGGACLLLLMGGALRCLPLLSVGEHAAPIVVGSASTLLVFVFPIAMQMLVGQVEPGSSPSTPRAANASARATTRWLPTSPDRILAAGDSRTVAAHDTRTLPAESPRRKKEWAHNAAHGDSPPTEAEQALAAGNARRPRSPKGMRPLQLKTAGMTHHGPATPPRSLAEVLAEHRKPAF